MEFINLIFTALYGQSSGTSMAKVQVIYQKPNQNYDLAQKLFLFAQSRAPDTFTSPVVENSRPTGTTRFWLDSKISFTVPVTTTMIQANLNLSMWFNVSVRQGKINVALMQMVAKKIIFLAHHIAAVLGKKDATNHIQTTLHGVIAEGVTNINDGDYYVDLDIKIHYKLSFWYHLFFIDVLKLKTSIRSGFYNPSNHICKVLHMIAAHSAHMTFKVIYWSSFLNRHEYTVD